MQIHNQLEKIQKQVTEQRFKLINPDCKIINCRKEIKQRKILMSFLVLNMIM